MPRYLFREGVDISAEGNDMVVTTPYATRANPNRQTLRFKGVKESLKEILKELSQAGIESNQYLAIPEKIESTAPHLALEPQLKMLYKNGLLIHEIDGCNGIAMRLLPIHPGLEQHPYPETEKEFKHSKFISI